MLPKTRIIPVGLVGARLIPTYGAGAEPSEESPTPFYFNYPTSTFTVGMAKRATTPFAASPVIQGTRDGSGVPDLLSLSRGTAAIAGLYFYPNFDPNQGSFTLFWTPEYSSGGIATNYHYFLYASSTFFFAYDYSNSWYYIKIGNQTLTVAAAVTAGTKVTLCFSWDCKNKIDGTNHARVSINDAHTFGITTVPTLGAPDSALYIGSNGALFGNCGLEQGITLSRRVLWDGAYGVNVGNGDEINLIYAAGAGADPCTITGSWDVCLCVPTNSTVGPIVTGVGEAWSHPHSSNLLTDGWLQSYYGNQWGLSFVATGQINCTSNAGLDNLHDAAFTAEGWFLSKVHTAGSQVLINKGDSTGVGWDLFLGSTEVDARINCAGTDASLVVASTKPNDGKWHHWAITWDDAGDRKVRIFLDGVLIGTSAAGVGAVVDDSATDLIIGGWSTNNLRLYGSVGWCRISNVVRYTVDFKPSRTIPVADANTLAQWAVDEGTGATLNSTGTLETAVPGSADGTITAGTWQPQWYAEGTPIVPTSVQGGTAYRIDCGSGITLDDLHASDFAVEGWFRITTGPTTQRLATKSDLATSGWTFNVSGGKLQGVVCCAGGVVVVASGARVDDNRWHYLKMVYDFSIDRKIRLYIDNVADGVSVATAGAVVSDAAQNLIIGGSLNTLLLAHGWIMVSNTPRGAGMLSRSNPRAVDANTMARWVCTEGFGTAIADDSGNANNGTAAGTYTWVNTGAMDVDSPGARVFGWGDARGSDAVNEGEKITYTGLTAGANYVIRGLGYSEDGVGIPRVVIYDETNAAVITAITGLATSTEWTPDVLIFSFELPTNARGAAADCTSISIKRISTTAGNVGWHQCELYANLLDNPSLDTGAVAAPFIPYGWTNDGCLAGDAEQELVIRHSEGGSWQTNPAANQRAITFSIGLAAGKFLSFGGWYYGDVGSSVWYSTLAYAQYSINLAWLSFGLGLTWGHAKVVIRNNSNPNSQYVYYSPSAFTDYADDLYAIALDDVTLTVTPASAANSLEGTGIRADGYDLLSTPTAGEMSANWWYAEVFITPRHSDADVAKFGIATPCWIELRYNAANTLLLDWSAANTLRLRVVTGGVTYTATWATGGGAVLAGTKYLIKIEQYYGEYRVFVGGVQRITIPGVPAFSFIPNIAYWGMDNARVYNSDIVVSSY